MSAVTALTFAGGTGQRMSTRATPKQFLELHGKPVIIYTIEHFEKHPQVDRIVVVCLESWIPELEALAASPRHPQGDDDRPRSARPVMRRSTTD